MKVHRIIITPGEPAGIGPDLVVQIAQRNWPVELVVCADATLLQNRAKLLNLPLVLLPYIQNKKSVMQRAGTLTLLPVALYSSVVPGYLNIKNVHYVINTLAIASDSCQHGKFAALVTGPVHKGIINDSGIPFTGHTEFFEKRTHSQKAVMMLIAKSLRLALVTTHLPIKKISVTITKDLLRNVITVLHYDLCSKFGIKKPHILVCGLNPHAGENGSIGSEEINTIIPVLEEMKMSGINLNGPLPADTIFQQKYINNADVILAMYHDQGLPVIKYHDFNYGVNTTLGLPFIRTSVDHGTALDLAGRGGANVSSFINAINLAIKMVSNIK